ADVLGEIVGGKLPSSRPIKPIVALPFVLMVVYVIMFVLGSFLVPMMIISIAWGTLAGISANVTQYVVTSSAPAAPDLSNGIYLSAVNFGTTVGTFIGGLFITGLGSNYVLIIGI